MAITASPESHHASLSNASAGRMPEAINVHSNPCWIMCANALSNRRKESTIAGIGSQPTAGV